VRLPGEPLAENRPDPNVKVIVSGGSTPGSKLHPTLEPLAAKTRP
jgi:hypothetical protein